MEISSTPRRARWSNGCSLCVKRRVKCDEKRPACGNCIRYGQACPGYARQLVFLQAQTHRRSKKGRHSSTTDSPSDVSCNEVASVKIPNSIVSPQLFQNQAVAAVSDIIQQEHRIVWDWFRDLPVMAGQCRALDSAVQTFSLGMIGRSRGDSGILAQSRASYVKALSQLQNSLCHRDRWKASETLCASVLLCLFELFAGTTTPENYFHHAQGIGTLIEARGPHDDLWTSFDITLVQASRSTLIAASIFGAGRCRLTDKEWRSFFRAHPPDSLPEELHAFYEDFYDLLSEMPVIAHKGQARLRAFASSSYIEPAEDESLLSHTIAVYQRWNAWNQQFLAKFPPPIEVPSPRGDDRFPMVYMYDDVWRAAAQIMYNSCIIIMNLVFAVVGYGGDRSAEVSGSVDWICKSVEMTSRGVFGPNRVGFGLRIAYEAASPEIRLWIEGWLKDFDRSYAATNREAYPTTTAADILARRAI